MSISAVSSSSVAVYSTVNSNSLAQDWQTLQNALQQGDIASAQSAFSAIERAMMGSDPALAASSSNENSQVNQAMQSLQTALQNGNVASAKNAFNSIEAAMKNALQHSQSNGSQSQGVSFTSNGSSSHSPNTGSMLNVLA